MSKLLDTLFTIKEYAAGANTVEAEISIDRLHPVFAGHFPGMPVVPGVCMMQLVKTLAERFTSTTLLLSVAESIKFLQVIDPGQHRTVRVSLQTVGGITSSFKVEAVLFSESTIFFKLKAFYTRQG